MADPRGGGTRDARPRASKFSHFHAVFSKKMKSNSKFGSWRTPLGKILDRPLLTNSWCIGTGPSTILENGGKMEEQQVILSVFLVLVYHVEKPHQFISLPYLLTKVPSHKRVYLNHYLTQRDFLEENWSITRINSLRGMSRNIAQYSGTVLSYALSEITMSDAGQYGCLFKGAMMCAFDQYLLVGQ